MTVHRPDRYWIVVGTVVWMVGTVGVEGIRDREAADLAVTGDRMIVVVGSTFAAVRTVEPAGTAAVGASVRH